MFNPFAQALVQNIQNLGIKKSYRSDLDFKRLVRRMAALTFLPLDHIDTAWLRIMELTPQLDEQNPITKVTDYFLNNWMENDNRFPCSMWNNYQNYITRTINHLERWHHCLKKLCGNPNKNILEFIRILKSEQQKFENKIVIVDAGNSP